MTQHIHILGICGTFMGSLAQLAKAQGYRVTGCDANVYPPMSDQLEQAGIELIEGFELDQLNLQPDQFVIGNALSRGNPLVEAILNRGLPYTSGPQWLHDHLLQNKWVLAVAGTHGKTTTSSMLAWILEYAGMAPGFLIGGVPNNFSVSARLGNSSFFVIEADEYDCAFFDKRSKFVHYLARTLVINNLEFDHADIFPDLSAIQSQFHYLLRSVPEQGLILYPEQHSAISEVFDQGCWTPKASIAVDSTTADWSVKRLKDDGSAFKVIHQNDAVAEVRWSQLGQHNLANGLAAVAAAHHVGVTVDLAAEALKQFTGVKRRLECLAEIEGVWVYDDFAHHPTAIAATLEGLRANVGQQQILVLIEPRSNTMRMGIHQQQLATAFTAADQVLWFAPEDLPWDIKTVIDLSPVPVRVSKSIPELIQWTKYLVKPPAHIVIMSNGGFGGIHQQLIQRLTSG